jgi:chorismate-pyruvate lyase
MAGASSSGTQHPAIAASIPRLNALDEFYASCRARVPKLVPIDGAEIPEPYRSLLVHDGDMTPTLEDFHNGSIHLEVLRAQCDGTRYSRDVILRMDATDKPVEFGAIEIDLSLFAPQARKDILAAHRPLGAILRDHAVEHDSRPKAFFSVRTDRVIRNSLRIPRSGIVYGRRNTLYVPDGRPLAEIVEILPP